MECWCLKNLKLFQYFNVLLKERSLRESIQMFILEIRCNISTKSSWSLECVSFVSDDLNNLSLDFQFKNEPQAFHFVVTFSYVCDDDEKFQRIISNASQWNWSDTEWFSFDIIWFMIITDFMVIPNDILPEAWISVISF